MNFVNLARVAYGISKLSVNKTKVDANVHSLQSSAKSFCRGLTRYDAFLLPDTFASLTYYDVSCGPCIHSSEFLFKLDLHSLCGYIYLLRIIPVEERTMMEVFECWCLPFFFFTFLKCSSQPSILFLFEYPRNLA